MSDALYTDKNFNDKSAFLTVFDFFYGGKSACEAIDESVFSMSQTLNHGGGVSIETLQRRCKIQWNLPSQLAASKCVEAVAEEMTLRNVNPVPLSFIKDL